jgi:hypothetical protein
MATEIFSMRWQVRHSKTRSSKPRSPGEIRVNPILCLQVRHIGRSTMDEIRIAQTPLKPYGFPRMAVCPVPDSRPKFGANVNGLRVKLACKASGPESPLSLGLGRASGGEDSAPIVEHSKVGADGARPAASEAGCAVCPAPQAHR